MKWFCSCNAVNAEFANYCHNCKSNRWTSIQNTTIDILKQQILDAENVIRDIDKYTEDESFLRTITKNYWEKYEK